MNEITLKKYVLHREREAYEKVGWAYEGPAPGCHGEWSCIMSRDFDDESRERISVTTANRLKGGEIEIIALIDGQEHVLVSSRTVAASLQANIGRALSEG